MNIMYQETLNGHGILKLFFEVNVAPIIFNTEIQFKREIFIGEYVELHMDILPSSPDMRKFQRTIKFFSADSSEAVAVVSNGAFFDLKKRRVTSPPNAVVMSFIRSGLVSKSAD